MDDLRQAIIAQRDGDTNTATQQEHLQAGSSESFIIQNGSSKTKGALVNGRIVGTKEGTSVMVNGSAFVPGTIDGIHDIKLVTDSGIFYDFTIIVDGACPKGKWDNKMEFTDESGDTYTLRIFSTSRKKHTVNYHSSAGSIKKITWDI